MENKRKYKQNAMNYFNRKDYLVNAFIRVGRGLLDSNNPFFDFNNFHSSLLNQHSSDNDRNRND